MAYLRNPTIAILALGLLARLPGIASRPLWYDEAFAVLFSSKGPKAMAYGTLAVEAGVAADVHPLGYYTLLWGWGEILGRSPLVVRTLSVIIGLGVILIGVRIAQSLFGRKVGMLAGVLLAVSPFQVHYSQEVRMYGLLTLLLLLTTYWQWKLLESPRKWTWIAYGITAAAAQYSHNLASLYLLPLSLVPLLARNWRAVRHTLLSGGLAILLYSPWLIDVPSQLARVRWAYWIPQPGVTELLRTFLQFVSGLPVPVIAIPEIVLLGVVLFLGILVGVIASLATIRVLRSDQSSKWIIAVPAYLAVAPVVLMFLISQWQPVYLDRAMLPSAAMFVIWIAAAMNTAEASGIFRRSAFISLAIAFSIGLIGFYSHRGFPYAPFSELNEKISANLRSGEIVLHSNKITAFSAIYYGSDIEHRYLADPPGSDSDTLAPATQEVLGYLADASAVVATEGKSGVWFVVFDQEIEDYRSLGYSSHPALGELENIYESADLDQFGDLKLIHFFNPREGSEA